jgi:acid phosphatase type 7
MPRPPLASLLPLLVAMVIAAGCGDQASSQGPAPPTTAQTTASAPAAVPGPRHPRLVAAGDIACPPRQRPSPISCRQAQTAALVRSLNPDLVAVLGDLQYPSGSLSHFRRSFGASWGRLGPRLRPVPGNHEYQTRGAAGYFAYFGRAARPRGRSWYSYDLGDWHLVALDSQCTGGSCRSGGAQERFLRADLARTRKRCVLAYWHHPRFSSGIHGDDRLVAPLFEALYRARAEVVLSGHDHGYERLAPLNPAGRVDTGRGVRSFVVGTGGFDLRPILRRRAGSERRHTRSFGVLELTLRPDGYDWRFRAEPGAAFTDSGSGRCI